jgi:hypothetical protein
MRLLIALVLCSAATLPIIAQKAASNDNAAVREIVRQYVDAREKRAVRSSWSAVTALATRSMRCWSATTRMTFDREILLKPTGIAYAECGRPQQARALAEGMSNAGEPLLGILSPDHKDRLPRPWLPAVILSTSLDCSRALRSRRMRRMSGCAV